MSSIKNDRGRETTGEGPRYKLELYMIGTTPSSSRALVNARSLCEKHLPGRYDLQVIDVSVEREAANREQIIAAPTLIVRSPLPEQRFIGDLSDESRFRSRLNL